MPRSSVRPTPVGERPEHDKAKSLTLAAAADFLGVTQSYLLHLVEEGTLTAAIESGERVIPRPVIIAYQRRRDAERRAHLDELIRLSEEAGMDDVDYAAIITRMTT